MFKTLLRSNVGFKKKKKYCNHYKLLDVTRKYTDNADIRGKNNIKLFRNVSNNVYAM